MKPTQISRSTTLPVTLEQIKQQCRMRSSDTSQDDHLLFLAAVAVELVESEVNRSLVETKYELSLDAFPARDKEGKSAIYFYRPPVVSIESIKYYNESNVLTTIASSEYVADLKAQDPFVMEATGCTWPSDLYDKPNVITVAYTANTPALSNSVQLAICELVAGARRASGGVTVESLKLMPHWFGIQRLLAREYRYEV